MSRAERHPKCNEFLIACCSSFDQAEYLLRTHPELLEARDGVGETPLHYLVIENRVEEVQFLIEHDANVNTQDNSGSTPLLAATAMGYTDMVRLLLASAADPSVRNVTHGSTLHAAAACGTRPTAAIAEMLLEHGVPLEAPDDYDRTSLMVAASEGNADVVRLLLARGANPNSRATGWMSQTVLHCAAESKNSNPEIIALLLQAGADPRATDDEGETPYQVAIAAGNIDLADLLQVKT